MSLSYCEVLFRALKCALLECSLRDEKQYFFKWHGEIECWAKADFYDGLNIFLSTEQRFIATMSDTFWLKPVKYLGTGLER